VFAPATVIKFKFAIMWHSKLPTWYVVIVDVAEVVTDDVAEED
jgi:hypothetical protein